MGLVGVFGIAFREIAFVRREGVLGRDLTKAGDGAHFATTDDIVECLEMGRIGGVVWVEIEVLPLVAASIAKRIGRRCGGGLGMD